eukprot:5343773-Pyramimonas_sp.AAC.1
MKPPLFQAFPWARGPPNTSQLKNQPLRFLRRTLAALQHGVGAPRRRGHLRPSPSGGVDRSDA